MLLELVNYQQSSVFKKSVIGLCSPLLMITVLSGCVQKATYNNTGKPAPVAEKVDNIDAAKTRIALGLQYLKVGQMSNAKFNLEKAKTFAPNLSNVHTAFAYYYQQVGENSLAEDAYKKALKLDKNDADALNNYGTFLCKMKRFDEAEKTLLRAINVPSYLQVAQSYENAALCALDNQQYEKAKQYFDQSLSHSALRANTLVNVAGLSYAMGEYKQAQQYAQRLENIGVVSPRVLLLRALIELKLGRMSQSKKYGTTLVSMYVKSPEALMYLSKSFENSEFEQLRRVYLQHQYQQYSKSQLAQQADSGQNEGQSQPAVKTKRKLTQNSDGTTTTTTIAKTAKSTQATQMPLTLTARKKANPADDSQLQGHSLVTKKSEAQTKTVAQKQTVKLAAKPSTESSTEPSSEPSMPKPVTKPPVPATNEATDGQIVEVPVHVVKAGETLFDLSFTYNIKMNRLKEWNGISDSGKLLVGQKVYLREPNFYHTIDEGDTLYGISLKYNIRLDSLKQWNKLSDNARLITGQKILIVNPKNYSL